MTDEPRPLWFRWEGDGFVPLTKLWQKRADEQYVVGQQYRLAPYEERSINSHNHYFVCISEAWKNLPEHLAERFQSAEHLRKYALIKTGYRNERSIVAASKSEAQKVAAFVRPMDDYALVVVSERVVTIYTARSQSIRAMNKEVFGESKNAVLDMISEMVGVSAGELRDNAGRAA